jgi:serine/threonine protein kinase
MAVLIDQKNGNRLIQQLFVGLFTLHSQDIVHGDINPSSVYFVRNQDDSAWNIRLGDIKRQRKMFTIPQTQQSLSESESKSGSTTTQDLLNSSSQPTKTSDILEAGCLVYFILSGGHFPFEAQSQEESLSILQTAKVRELVKRER